MNRIDKKKRVQRALTVFAACVVLGPPIGGFLFFVPMFVFGISTGKEPELFREVGLTVLSFVLGGYLLGFIPALLAGLAAGVRVMKVGGLTYGSAIVCALSGALANSIFSALYIGSWVGILGTQLQLVISFFSASILWVLLGRFVGLSPEPIAVENAQ